MTTGLILGADMKFPAIIKLSDGTHKEILRASSLPIGQEFMVLTPEQVAEWRKSLQTQEREKAVKEMHELVKTAEKAISRAKEIADEYGVEFYFGIDNGGASTYNGATEENWKSSAGSCGWTNPGEEAPHGWVSSSSYC